MPSQQMQLYIDGVSSVGPFALVAGVGDMSVDLMNQGLPGTSPTGGDAVATTVTIISQTGQPGLPGPPGPPGPPVSGVSGQFVITPDFDGLYASDSATEVVVDESLEDFDRLATGTISIEVTLKVMVPNGGTGTVRVRSAGTSGAADGTTIATATVTSTSSYQDLKVTGTFTNPLGLKILKLTLQSSAGDLDVLAKQVVVTIS